jgi:hypothetical protein
MISPQKSSDTILTDAGWCGCLVQKIDLDGKFREA